MSYDNMGRQTQLTPPDGAPVEIQAWDRRSRRVLLKDGTGSAGFGYYADGRLQTAQTPRGRIDYGYDPGGRRTSMVYSAGVVQYGYDRDNNLEQVISVFNETTGYQWDLAEKLTQVTLPNGSVVSLSYDMADRLVYKGDPDIASGIGFKYGLDMNGNRTTITENDGSVTTNVFDNKNRLITEIRTGVDPYSCNYAYDLNDGLIYRDLPGSGNVTFELDVMQKITGGGYIWDADGRLLSRTVGSAQVTFSYDYADRVSGMTVGSGSSALTLAYHYDGDGGLQWLQRNGLRSQFLLDGRDVLREWLPLTITRSTNTVALRPRDLVRLDLNVLSQQVVDYTHGVGLISQRVTTLTTTPQTYSTDFFRWDGRATSRRQEDPSKADLNDTIYDAYGLLRSPKTLTSAYGFVGEEGVRQEKGQAPDLVVPYHMRARMYDPLLGRFTSRDPVWDVNLYEYAKDNPWSNIDPNGDRYLPTSIDPTGVWESILERADFAAFTPEDQALTLEDIRNVVRYSENRPWRRTGTPAQMSWVNTFWGDLNLRESRSNNPNAGSQTAAMSRLRSMNPAYDSHVNPVHWPTVAEWTAAFTLQGLGAGALVAVLVVATDGLALPIIAIAGTLYIGYQWVKDYRTRAAEDRLQNHHHLTGTLILVSGADVAGLSDLASGLTGHDILTDVTLSSEKRSVALGKGAGNILGQAAGEGAGKAITGVLLTRKIVAVFQEGKRGHLETGGQLEQTDSEGQLEESEELNVRLRNKGPQAKSEIQAALLLKKHGYRVEFQTATGNQPSAKRMVAQGTSDLLVSGGRFGTGERVEVYRASTAKIATIGSALRDKARRQAKVLILDLEGSQLTVSNARGLIRELRGSGVKLLIIVDKGS